MLTATSGRAGPALTSPLGTSKKRSISHQAIPCGPAGWPEQEVHTSPVQGGHPGTAASTLAPWPWRSLCTPRMRNQGPHAPGDAGEVGHDILEVLVWDVSEGRVVGKGDDRAAVLAPPACGERRAAVGTPRAAGADGPRSHRGDLGQSPSAPAPRPAPRSRSPASRDHRAPAPLHTRPAPAPAPPLPRPCPIAPPHPRPPPTLLSPAPCTQLRPLPPPRLPRP